jgi:hypothetical protein
LNFSAIIINYSKRELPGLETTISIRNIFEQEDAERTENLALYSVFSVSSCSKQFS